MLALKAAIERERRKFSQGIILFGAFVVCIVIFFYIDFVENVVAPKGLHGNGGVTLYHVVRAAVVPVPLVAAFAWVRYDPAVAFFVAVITLNMILLWVLSSAFSLSHAIGSSFVTSLLIGIFYACAYFAYNFQVPYFQGAFHSQTHIEHEDETSEDDEEVSNRTLQ